MRRWSRINYYSAAMAMLALQLFITASCNLEQAAVAAAKKPAFHNDHPTHGAHNAHKKKKQLELHDIPGVVKGMGLKLRNRRAERAFFAKDYARVAYDDFHALWERTEQAKRDEEKLVAAHASEHSIVCNKLLKVGTEAVMYEIFKLPDYAQEHLLKFRINLPLAGRTCKDAGL